MVQDGGIMTVKELIKILEGYNSEAIVKVSKNTCNDYSEDVWVTPELMACGRTFSVLIKG